MSMQRCLLSAAGILVLLSVCQQDASAQTKPLKITGAGTVDAFPGFGVTDFFSSGTATHLGNYTSEGVVGATSPTTFEGTVTFTAANGDRLEFEYSGNVTLNFESEDRVSSSVWDATFTPISGDGRFARVTGGSIQMIARTGAFLLEDTDIPFTWSGSGSLEFAKVKE